MTHPKIPSQQAQQIEVLQAPPLKGLSAVANVAGVLGKNITDGPGVAAVSKLGNGIEGLSIASNRSGIWADNTAGGNGVTGTSDLADGVGVYGRGARVGVYGATPGDDGHDRSAAQGGLAGFFAGNVTVQGDVNVTGDIRLVSGNDCAENFDVAGPGEFDPGTVMVIGPGGALTRSQLGYDKRVAGVISGAGSFKPGIILGQLQSQHDRRPIALLGRVYCKVDAQYGPLEVGDLLTTSPTPGHAMKVVDPTRACGAILGKALQPLAKGEGLIPILIALQ